MMPSKRKFSANPVAVSTLLLTMTAVFSMNGNAGNPWHEDSRVTIDEELVKKPEDNMWSDKQAPNQGVDPSLYPPLDEDITLGITLPVYPGVDEKDVKTPDEPVYEFPPEAPRDNAFAPYPGAPYGGGYPGGYRDGGYPGGYRGGYGYQRGPFGSGWPGNNFRSSGPFGGDNWGGMPFGWGDSWMPFGGGPGFW
jgi:hypothetical protein